MIRFVLRLWFVIVLVVEFLRQLVVSAVSVAVASLGPTNRLHSSVLKVPLVLETELGMATLANLVSLTPGTTSLHVDREAQILYVHILDVSDPDAAIADIKNSFERIIRRIEV